MFWCTDVWALDTLMDRAMSWAVQCSRDLNAASLLVVGAVCLPRLLLGLRHPITGADRLVAVGGGGWVSKLIS